ncbi:conserved hypothetical protein [Tenacibaculum sediminilitoris]|uniref:hypothetical protein n=1 Tax=Tenacibaculum sediminilitoris TaxID=1820334 RepID=UPI0038963331
MEITLTSSFSYQNSVGKYTKRYQIGKNVGILYTANSEVPTVFGLISTQWKLGEAFLDENNHLKIPIYHLVSTKNNLTINITGLSKTSFDKNLITISTPTTVVNNETRDYITYKSQVNILDKLGIGTNDTKGFNLAVNGKIRAKEIKVETGWSDFVFEKNYYLATLEEVEKHIKEKGHLKDIPSAKEVEKNGIFLGEMDAKLLQKIEELTLYTIQQQKEIEKLKKQNSKTEKENALLKSLLQRVSKLEETIQNNSK